MAPDIHYRISGRAELLFTWLIVRCTIPSFCWKAFDLVPYFDHIEDRERNDADTKADMEVHRHCGMDLESGVDFCTANVP